MARLILLSISMFLLMALVFESSIAWPYPDDEDSVAEKMQDTDDDDEPLNDLMVINEQTVKRQDKDDEQLSDLMVTDEKEANKQDDGDDDDTGDDDNAKENAVLEEEEVEENAVAQADMDGKLIANIEQAGVCGCDLKAYDKKYYRGRKLLLKQQNANFKNDYFNDRVESIKIKGTCQWLLYQHINFLGRSYILKPALYSTPSRWGGSGNQISSARALPPRGKVAIVLFEHANFRGRMLTLYASNSNFLRLNFNNQMSSFIITGGRWTLYEHANFKGKRVTRGPGRYSSPRSWSSYFNPGNDKISSVKRVNSHCINE